jgi:hypothetical protein
MRIPASVLCPFLAFAVWPAAAAFGQSPKKLPVFQSRATTQAVIDEHLDAINHCDWNRLIAQYPADVEFFLPGGQVVRGRQAVADMFVNIVKPVAQGGLCGLRFTVEHAFQVGNTLNVEWVATGDMLAEPYRGADAYETRNGMMAAQVTTFDPAQMKLKKTR